MREEWTPEQRVSYCIDIASKLIAEGRILRKKLRELRGIREKWDNRVIKFEEQIRKLKHQAKKRIEDYWDACKKIKKLEKEKKELEKEVEDLKRALKKTKKESNRKNNILFKMGPYACTERLEKTKKKKGGQVGHCDTNRENVRMVSWGREKKRVYRDTCPRCDGRINRVMATRERQYIDIDLSARVVQNILAVERQWCGCCRKEVRGQAENSLPFTEYGMTVFLIVLILKYKAGLSLSKIGIILETMAGLKMAKSSIVNCLNQAQGYLNGRYNDLLEAVRQDAITYSDETGWSIQGKKAWIWIIASDDVTVYKADAKRSKPVFVDLFGDSPSYNMHDGYGVYAKTVDSKKQMYCWAHILRFAHDECFAEPKDAGIHWVASQLNRIYKRIDTRQDMDHPHLFFESIMAELDELITYESNEPSVHKVQYRIKKQQIGLANALTYSPDGTNNLAERELRPIVINRKISYGSDSFAGMQRDAILASIIQTLSKKFSPSHILPQLNHAIRNGIHRIYSPPIILDSS